MSRRGGKHTMTEDQKLLTAIYVEAQETNKPQPHPSPGPGQNLRGQSAAAPS